MAHIGISPPPSVSREQVSRGARGVLAETVNLIAATSATALTSQQIFAVLLGLAQGDVVTSLCAAVSVAGAGTTPTTIKLALVSPAGVVLATTANVAGDAKWNTVGAKAFALTAPYSVQAAGGFYVAILSDGAFGTTALQLIRANAAAGADRALAGGVRAAASGGTGQTDIAGTLTLSDPGAGTAFWLAAA